MKQITLTESLIKHYFIILNSRPDYYYQTEFGTLPPTKLYEYNMDLGYLNKLFEKITSNIKTELDRSNDKQAVIDKTTKSISSCNTGLDYSNFRNDLEVYCDKCKMLFLDENLIFSEARYEKKYDSKVEVLFHIEQAKKIREKYLKIITIELLEEIIEYAKATEHQLVIEDEKNNEYGIKLIPNNLASVWNTWKQKQNIDIFIQLFEDNNNLKSISEKTPRNAIKKIMLFAKVLHHKNLIDIYGLDASQINRMFVESFGYKYKDDNNPLFNEVMRPVHFEEKTIVSTFNFTSLNDGIK